MKREASVANPIILSRLAFHVPRQFIWSGRWDLNPRQPAWKAGTLPLSYARLRLLFNLERRVLTSVFTLRTQHQPTSQFSQSPKREHLQPLTQLTPHVSSPNPRKRGIGGQARIRTLEDISQQIYSLPPLATWVPARVFH